MRRAFVSTSKRVFAKNPVEKLSEHSSCWPFSRPIIFVWPLPYWIGMGQSQLDGWPVTSIPHGPHGKRSGVHEITSQSSQIFSARKVSGSGQERRPRVGSTDLKLIRIRTRRQMDRHTVLTVLNHFFIQILLSVRGFRLFFYLPNCVLSKSIRFCNLATNHSHFNFG